MSFAICLAISTMLLDPVDVFWWSAVLWIALYIKQSSQKNFFGLLMPSVMSSIYNRGCKTVISDAPDTAPQGKENESGITAYCEQLLKKKTNHLRPCL